MARRQLGTAPSNAADTATKGYVDTATTDMVTTNGIQSLSNKTLSSPTINTPKINQIYDTNGVLLARLNAATNAVNYFAISNNITTGRPGLVAEGSDTNIGIAFVPKGTGDVQVYQPTGSATLAIEGNDTNVGLNITTKGTGVVTVNSNRVGVKVAVPSTATSTGVEGQWAADSSYIYVCTATNTWRRAAISSW